MEKSYTCHKCKEFISYDPFNTFPYYDEGSKKTYYFHLDCFNQYEHYYGIDKTID